MFYNIVKEPLLSFWTMILIHNFGGSGFTLRNCCQVTEVTKVSITTGRPWVPVPTHPQPFRSTDFSLWKLLKSCTAQSLVSRTFDWVIGADLMKYNCGKTTGEWHIRKNLRWLSPLQWLSQHQERIIAKTLTIRPNWGKEMNSCLVGLQGTEKRKKKQWYVPGLITSYSCSCFVS